MQNFNPMAAHMQMHQHAVNNAFAQQNMIMMHQQQSMMKQQQMMMHRV